MPSTLFHPHSVKLHIFHVFVFMIVVLYGLSISFFSKVLCIQLLSYLA